MHALRCPNVWLEQTATTRPRVRGSGDFKKIQKSTFLQLGPTFIATPRTYLRGFIVASGDEAIALGIKESHARYVARVSVDRARQELGGLDLNSRLMVACVGHRATVCLPWPRKRVYCCLAVLSFWLLPIDFPRGRPLLACPTRCSAVDTRAANNCNRRAVSCNSCAARLHRWTKKHPTPPPLNLHFLGAVRFSSVSHFGVAHKHG